jgi:hypothetical protein
MTTANPRVRNLSRWACIAGLAGLFVLSGCKSRDGNGGGVGGLGSSGGKQRDPLVYGPSRIPPQNVPLPERDGVGSKDRDPLTAPVGRAGDKSGSGYSDDPRRFQGTYIPGPGTTPAALAAKLRDDDTLKIDTPDNRVPLKPTGAVIPAGATLPSNTEADGALAELERQYGVKREDRSLIQENGEYIFRASVPISGNGAKRQYTGVGTTAAEAVKQVLDQVVADRR